MSDNIQIEERPDNSSPELASTFISKKRALLLGFLTFAILTGLMGTLAYQRLLINREAIKKQTYDHLLVTKEKLQEALAQGISSARTLSFFIQKDGAVENFDSLAEQIFAVNRGIDVLELLPAGVIRYVYPLAGNETVIGYDILKDPTRNKEAFRAIQKNQIFYAGPLVLRQGGMGVIGRVPIYRNNNFWGFSAMIIKMNTLLNAAGIDSLGKSGYYFQLSKINPDSHQEEFFISHPFITYPENFITVDMYNGEWKLSAMPVTSGKGYADFFWLSLLGFVIALMGGLFVFTVVKKPQKLDRLVKLRTAALQESEERYRLLIEQAPDGVVVYSFDGTIHQFNKSAYTELGYTQKEFSTLNLKDILIEKIVVVDQERADLIKAGIKTNFQRQLLKKDGSVIDVEINASLLPDGKILAFIRNITARQLVEKALKKSEEKFSRIFQSDLLCLAIYDDQRNLVDMNECFASIMETSRSELFGEKAGELNFLAAENVTKRNRKFESLAEILKANEALTNKEIIIEKNDGKLIFLLASVEQLDLNNEPNWLIAAIDITQKKNAELSLIDNEKKYRSLIEQASDGIIISDLKGIITEVNRSICNMGGYSMAEMIGKPIDNFMPKEDIKGKPLRIEDLVKGKTLLYERRMQKKDRTVIDVEINSKMAIGNTLIGFVRNITERKKAEEDLKKSNERFELIAQATNDAIWDHDFIKNETVGNQNLYILYGLEPGKDHINFEMFESHLHPDDRPRAIKNMRTAISEKAASIAVEFRFETAKGNYKHLYIRAYIKYNDKGKEARMVGVMQDITGRIQDGQRLLKEKELSDSIINSLPAVFYLYSLDGKFLRWNNNFEIVTGYNAGEISRLHPLDLFDEDEKNLLGDKIKNVFFAGEDNVEAHFLLKNGQKIPYYFSGMKINYEGESCLMGFGLDFSDKVKSDKIIKESEQKFRSLVEQASDGVAILSDGGAILYVSPSVERILGYTETEMMQFNAFNLAHPDDSITVGKVFGEVMQNPGVPVKGVIGTVLHKDGSWRKLELTLTNMFHIPSINGIVENFRDITEQLQIEKKIITEKELSDSIINSLPGIFYLYDNTGRFLRWNRNFEIVTGYNADEIRKMQPLDFYDEDQRPVVNERIKNVFQKTMPDVEFLLLTKDRRKIPFYYNSISIEYEGLPSIVGMAFDVTERKKIEQELLVSNRHLEQKASELKASYAELERFAYIVSHDLQEPLRMVSSFLKLLQQRYKSKLDETAEKYIFFAVDGADRMKQLISDLLEYSRTGSNRDIAADTDMNEVVIEVLKVFEGSIKENNVLIEVGPLPVLPDTSKIQMFQLMQNLVSNAVKYHSEKKLVIKINAKDVGDKWIFSIQDNGIGIDAKFSEKIFIIFQRLHNKDEFSGTGIGLSICKKIVEKHGGNIWLESEVGKGSTFYFSIPKKAVG